MVKYKIMHQGDEILISVTADNQNYIAKLSGTHIPGDVLITGKDEHEIYLNCRSWASTNIRGEFVFEPVRSVAPAIGL